jgi:hypothetical protein
MEVPQLHGFGPAANRLLEAYKMLLKVTFLCLAKIVFLKPMILSKLLEIKNQEATHHSKFVYHQFIAEVSIHKCGAYHFICIYIRASVCLTERKVERIFLIFSSIEL